MNERVVGGFSSVCRSKPKKSRHGRVMVSPANPGATPARASAADADGGGGLAPATPLPAPLACVCVRAATRPYLPPNIPVKTKQNTLAYASGAAALRTEKGARKQS